MPALFPSRYSGSRCKELGSAVPERCWAVWWIAGDAGKLRIFSGVQQHRSLQMTPPSEPREAGSLQRCI
eukprot:3042483-Rhodomonas_salina.1